MAKIVMAVGKSLGPWFDPAKPEKQEPEYVKIHAGEGVGEFTVEQAIVWDAARRGEFSAHADHKFNRAALEALVRKNSGIKNPSAAVDFLLREGVLVEADLDDDTMKPFLKKYRLIPTAESLGNYKDKRDLYSLSREGQVLMPISLGARAIWAFSYLDGSLWNGCEREAQSWRKQGSKVTAETFGREIAEFLPAIIAVGAGILEPIG